MRQLSISIAAVVAVACNGRVSDGAPPSSTADARDETGEAATDAVGYDVDPFAGYRLIDAGHCEVESHIPGVTGNHCCDGQECNGDCVVPIIAPESTPVCWCEGIVGGCPVGGGLVCCSVGTAAACAPPDACHR